MIESCSDTCTVSGWFAPPLPMVTETTRSSFACWSVLPMAFAKSCIRESSLMVVGPKFLLE